MGKPKNPTKWRRMKRDGYVVKGISQPHWWETWVNGDKDMCRSTRKRLQRDTKQQVREALDDRNITFRDVGE